MLNSLSVKDPSAANPASSSRTHPTVVSIPFQVPRRLASQIVLSLKCSAHQYDRQESTHCSILAYCSHPFECVFFCVCVQAGLVGVGSTCMHLRGKGPPVRSPALGDAALAALWPGTTCGLAAAYVPSAYTVCLPLPGRPAGKRHGAAGHFPP